MQAAEAGNAVIERHAYAKVNLYLHVTGRRADGYHELDSLFVRAGIGDLLTIEPAPDLSLTIEGPFADKLTSDADDNLVLAAARRLADALGVAPKAAMKLQKNLPVAAGLGGGSADAAAALSGLITLWQGELPADRLRAIAFDLGADVPACLETRPQQVAGAGEILRNAPVLPNAWLVLVNPGVDLPTGRVFQRFDGGFGEPAPLARAPSTLNELVDELALRGNDLERPAIEVEPVIAEVSAALAGEAGILLARMSGSGATCFGLAADEAAARAASQEIAAVRPDWWAAAAPILPQR